MWRRWMDVPIPSSSITFIRPASVMPRRGSGESLLTGYLHYLNGFTFDCGLDRPRPSYRGAIMPPSHRKGRWRRTVSFPPSRPFHPLRWGRRARRAGAIWLDRKRRHTSRTVLYWSGVRYSLNESGERLTSVGLWPQWALLERPLLS